MTTSDPTPDFGDASNQNPEHTNDGTFSDDQLDSSGQPDIYLEVSLYEGAVLSELEDKIPEVAEIQNMRTALEHMVPNPSCLNMLQIVTSRVENMAESDVSDEAYAPIVRVMQLLIVVEKIAVVMRDESFATKQEAQANVMICTHLSDTEKRALLDLINTFVIGDSLDITDANEINAVLDSEREKERALRDSTTLGRHVGTILDDILVAKYGIDPNSSDYSELRVAVRTAAVMNMPDMIGDVTELLDTLGIPHDEFYQVAHWVIEQIND